MKSMSRSCLLGVVAGLLCSAIGCGGSYGSAGGSAGASAAIKLATNASVGSYLVDGNGRSLYYFGKDVPASGSNAAVSNCSGGCAAAWPSFHAGSAAVEGITGGDVGEITRADGSKQTTYLGWPLYFFAGDGKAGDVNGEGVDEVWFVLHADAYSIALMSNATGQAPQLYLSDGEGGSLYYFFQDTKGTATTDPISACTSATCLGSWKVFVSDETLIPTALHASDFTAFTRPDGQRQSAYKGHPLYHFAGDAAAGETRGRGVNNAWDTLDPRAL